MNICLCLTSRYVWQGTEWTKRGGKAMGYDEKAVCPHCGKTATGHDEIEEKFGYGDMGDGRVIVQSWCRECRIEERRQNG